MNNFFSGWRRKVGVFTLFLAFVFVGGWVRANLSNDRVTIQFLNSVHVIGSAEGQFQWVHFNGDIPNDPPLTWQSWPVGVRIAHPGLYMVFDGRLRWGAFDLGWGRRWNFGHAHE